MYKEEVGNVAEMAVKKKDFLGNNFLGYILSSMQAGMYVGVAITLIFVIGGLLNDANSPMTKILMGVCFGASASLVVVAGAELFSANVFVMALGFLKKTVTFKEVVKVLLASYIGNLMGSVLTGFLVVKAGVTTGIIGDFIVLSSANKMSYDIMPLIFSGILCNTMVCLAGWCTYRLKEESARLIMIFWCLFIFITAGFEHSVANMTLFTMGVMVGGNPAVSLLGFGYNLLFSTLGNIIGAVVLLAIPYYIIAEKGKKI